jgi:hypothetical protein
MFGTVPIMTAIAAVLWATNITTYEIVLRGSLSRTQH